jgi:capsular exopolysaccharide synthesis family protein
MQNNPQTHMPVPVSASMPPAPLTYYTTPAEQGFHLRDYWHVIVKRKWWVLGVLLGMVITVVLVMLLMSPIYKVTTTLQIIQDNPSAIMGGDKADPLGAITGSSEIDRFYETQYKILESPTLALGIIDALNLKEHPSYKEIEKDNPDDPAWVIREKYAQYLQDHLKVEPVKNSYLVDISYKSTDKNLAMKIPETIQKEYLKLAMTTRQQSYTMLREWLENELTRLGRKLENSERNVYLHGQQKDYLSMEGSDENVIVRKYVEVSRLLTAAQSDKAMKEAQYRQIQEKGADAPLITNHPLIGQLRQSLIDLESQASGQSKIFGSNFPDYQAQTTRMRDLRKRLNQEIRRLEASVKADFEASTRAEALLQKEFDLQKGRVIDLQDSLVDQHILKRDLQTNQTLYEGLLARMKEANVASSMVASNVSVITPAKMPYEPWIPRPLLFLVLTMFLGTMTGVAVAFFVEYLDSSIKTTDELEKVCHIPILGVVPKFTADSSETKELAEPPVVFLASHQPTSMVGEAFYHIRAAIMLSLSEAPPQAIVVTSANPNEGKTTIAANLAAVLAGSNRKCLLLDCDVRKPTLHKAFHQPLRPGLSNYLTGNATLEEIIRPTDVPNLYFIPAGPTPPNPNDLFNSTSFKNLITRLRQDFDHLIIDSAPVIGFADGLTISTMADGVLFVVKHHSTSREAGHLAIQLLSQTNARILGGILNMARKDRMGYGGYYGYYQYYHKHYKQYHETGKGESPNETRQLEP